MPIWVHDKTTLIATAHGFAWTEGKTYDLVRMPRDGLRRDQDPPSLVAFGTLDPKGETAVFRSYDKPLSIVQRGIGIRPCDARGHDAVALCRSASGALVAALREGESDDVWLARVSFADDALKVDARVALPVPPRLSPVPAWFVIGERSPWPDERPAASPRKATEEADGTAEPKGEPAPLALDVLAKRIGPYLRGTVRLSSNAHGVGVSSTYNGLCAVLDPTTLVPRLLVRVPAEQSQFDLFVCPLPLGALITAVANYRHTLFMLVDDEGKVVSTRDALGTDHAWGARTSAIALEPKKVLVSQELTNERLYTLALPTLKDKTFDADETGIIDHGGSDDGKALVIARASGNYMSPHDWTLLRLDGAKRVPLPPIDFRPPIAPAVAPAASPETGPPNLGVSADPSTPWTVPVGESVTIRLKVANTGGPATGLWVELGGEAVTSGCARAAHGMSAASRERAPFVPRATLPAAAVQASVPGEAAPTTMVEIEVRGVKPGKAILTVRIGPLTGKGPQSAGSGLCGRMFAVVAT